MNQMKPYSTLTILLVFLSTVVASCDKEKESSLPNTSSTNNGFPPPPPSNDIYAGLSPVSGTDQVFDFFNSSTYPISCYSTYCTIRSRYILRSDSSFLLQYNSDSNLYES